MSVEGFHSEWFTIGKHRVLLEARASFPDEEHRFIASVAAKTLDHKGSKAGIVRINYDDKACVYCVEIATTDPADQKLEAIITEILQLIYGYGNFICNVIMVEKGDEQSDHYHHMEHLSVGAGIATDRWAKS
jgi:hypothetical protein